MPVGFKDVSRDAQLLIFAKLPDRGPLACTCRELSELVRLVRIIGDDAPVPEGILYAHVEDRDVQMLSATLRTARELRLLDCSGTLTVPADTDLCHLRLHNSHGVVLRAADSPPDSPGMWHHLSVESTANVCIQGVFAPLTVRCTDGQLPPGAAARLLTATHVRLHSHSGPLPPMPAAKHLELLRCTYLPPVLHLPEVRHLQLVMCSGVVALTTPAAERMHVLMCSDLETIGDLPHAESVSVHTCHALRQVGASLTRVVSFVSCSTLTAIPEVPAVQKLTLNACRALASAGDLPALRSARIRECPLLPPLTGLPDDARVNTYR